MDHKPDVMNATSSSPTLSSLNLGGGLIEISALTALIGSTTVESLILGNQGAAGLVWGTMSVFGALSAIKACISATTPGWLRETLGVRTKEVDAAIGLTLDLNYKGFRSKIRARGAIGLACKIETDVHGKLASDGQSIDISRRDIYAFDRYIAAKLEILPDTALAKSVRAHLLARDPHSKERRMRNAIRDWISILISMSKLVEIVILWKHNAVFLSLISGLCWLYYFLAAIVLQSYGLSREYSENASGHEVDIIAGQLPTPMKTGGPHKILLGASENVRNSMLWKLTWAFGSLVSTAAVIGTYMTLGHQPATVFAVWAGFQFFWLAVRSVFYHFADGLDSVSNYSISLEKDWKSVSIHLKTRIRRLALALSAYQIHLHPRGIYSYEEDSQSLGSVENLQTVFELTSEAAERETTEIFVTAVIGDTLLSSACWILGSELTGLQLYDSCVIVLNIKGTSVAIPCARVLSDKPPPGPDIENGMEIKFPPRGIEPRYPVKGGEKTDTEITWWYWIPCGGNLWLQTHSTDMKFLGKRTADILTDDQVTKKLTSGDLFIGMSEVAHVKEVVQNSIAASHILQKFLH